MNSMAAAGAEIEGKALGNDIDGVNFFGGSRDFLVFLPWNSVLDCLVGYAGLPRCPQLTLRQWDG